MNFENLLNQDAYKNPEVLDFYARIKELKIEAKLMRISFPDQGYRLPRYSNQRRTIDGHPG